MSKFTILDFTKKFPDDTSCLTYLFQKRYGNRTCPKCERVGQYHRQGKTAHLVCNCGGDQVSPKAGTIFEKSSTDLVKWFFAIYLFSQSRNGVAAKELERELGVTYKTAWRMAKEIRKLMIDETGMLKGTVEADETWIGGRVRGKGKGNQRENKTIVFGAVERKGKVSTSIIKNVTTQTLSESVSDNIARGSKLMTDEWKSYKKIASVYGYEHETVRHMDKEYVRGDVHTNTIEGFWSQLKRSIDGTYHVVSPKYLSSYLGEFQFRYNYRKHDVCHLFDWMLSRVSLPHVLASQRISVYRLNARSLEC